MAKIFVVTRWEGDDRLIAGWSRDEARAQLEAAVLDGDVEEIDELPPVEVEKSAYTLGQTLELPIRREGDKMYVLLPEGEKLVITGERLPVIDPVTIQVAEIKVVVMPDGRYAEKPVFRAYRIRTVRDEFGVQPETG